MGRPVRVIVVLAVIAAAIVLSVGAAVLGDPDETALSVGLLLAFFASPVVGGLIVLRQPDNRIGWLFCVMGVFFPAAVLAEAWTYAATDRGLPGISEAAWLAEWLYFGFIVPGAVLIAVFPSGRLSSRRLLPFFVVTVGAGVLTATGLAFGSERFETASGWVPNAYRAPAPLAGWLLVAADVANVVLIASATFFAIVLLVRLRRAKGIERQQLKWFVTAAALIALVITIGFLLPSPWNDLAWAMMIAAFGAGLPIAAGIAIMRYRLFDIDRVIRRTLIYGVLIAVLGALYITLVIAFQFALSGIIGGDTLPVALSTLAIAALFGPVRARVRAVVDRRFYRSRYDAQRTLEGFAGRLREQVELDAVARTLVDVASDTVRPALATVWVRSRLA